METAMPDFALNREWRHTLLAEARGAWQIGNIHEDRARLIMHNVFWRVNGERIGSRLGSRWSRGLM